MNTKTQFKLIVVFLLLPFYGISQTFHFTPVTKKNKDFKEVMLGGEGEVYYSLVNNSFYSGEKQKAWQIRHYDQEFNTLVQLPIQEAEFTHVRAAYYLDGEIIMIAGQKQNTKGDQRITLFRLAPNGSLIDQKTVMDLERPSLAKSFITSDWTNGMGYLRFVKSKNRQYFLLIHEENLEVFNAKFERIGSFQVDLKKSKKNLLSSTISNDGTAYLLLANRDSQIELIQCKNNEQTQIRLPRLMAEGLGLVHFRMNIDLVPGKLLVSGILAPESRNFMRGGKANKPKANADMEGEQLGIQVSEIDLSTMQESSFRVLRFNPEIRELLPKKPTPTIFTEFKNRGFILHKGVPVFQLEKAYIYSRTSRSTYGTPSGHTVESKSERKFSKSSFVILMNMDDENPIQKAIDTRNLIPLSLFPPEFAGFGSYFILSKGEEIYFLNHTGNATSQKLKLETKQLDSNFEILSEESQITWEKTGIYYQINNPVRINEDTFVFQAGSRGKEGKMVVKF